MITATDEPGSAWITSALTTAEIAKLTAHTAVITVLMCRNWGVFQYWLGVDRRAIGNVNGCPNASDPAAINASVPAESAGVQ